MSSNKMSSVLVSVLVASVSLLGGSPAKAAPVTKITSCPFPITAAGSYLVVRDLSCPTTFGIQISNTSDVDLNVGGHTIMGSSASSGNGIEVFGATNVHIINGTVTGFTDMSGVLLGPGSSGTRVEAMTMSGNGEGLIINNSSNNTIFSCNISANNFDGVLTNFADNNSFEGNRVTGNAGVGYDLFLFSNNNVISSSISSSVIAGNQAKGVLISENSNNNIVRSSQLLNNVLNGVDVYPGVTGTRVLSNTVNGNGSGIVLRSGATGSTVKSNTAKNNADFDMEDDNGPTCDTNVWLHNNFNTANEPCIH